MSKIVSRMFCFLFILGAFSFGLLAQDRQITPEQTAMEVNRAHSQHQNDRSIVERGVQSMDNELDGLLKDAYDCPLTLDKAKSKIAGMRKKLDGCRKTLAKMKSRFDKIDKNDVDRMGSRIADLERERESIDKRLRLLGIPPEEERPLDDEEKSKHKKLNPEAIEGNKAKLQGQIDKVHREYLNLLNEARQERQKHPAVVELDNEIRRAQRDLAAKEQQKENAPPEAQQRLEQEIRDLENKLDGLEDKLDKEEKNSGLATGILRKIADKSRQLDDLERRLLPKIREQNEKQRKTLQTAKENYEEMGKDIDELGNKLDETASNLDLLEEYLKEKAKKEDQGDKDKFEELREKIEEKLSGPPGAPPSTPAPAAVAKMAAPGTSHPWVVRVMVSGGFASMSSANDYIDWINTSFSGDIGKMSTILGATLSVSYQITPLLGAGLAYEYLTCSAEGRLTIPAPPTPLDHSQSVTANGFLGFVTLSFPLNVPGLEVSGKLGAGPYFSSYKEIEDVFEVKGTGTGFGFQAGVVGRYFLSNNLGLCAEAAYRGISIKKYEDSSGNTLGYVPAYPAGGDVQSDLGGLYFSLGVFLRF